MKNRQYWLQDSTKQAIASCRPQFESINTILDFDKELNHFFKELNSNDGNANAANKNPAQAIQALLDVARMGMTIDRARNLAYVFVRDGGLAVVPSPKGLVCLAVEEGIILDATTAVVHQNDYYVDNGPDTKPTHRTANGQFATSQVRGPIVGVYCAADLMNGRVKVETMTIEEVEQCRSGSNSSSWKKFYGEMARKSVLKRAQKYWPRSLSGDSRFDAAIEVSNTAEGLDLSDTVSSSSSVHTDSNIPLTQRDCNENQVTDKDKQFIHQILRMCSANGSWKEGQKRLRDKYSQDMNTLIYAARLMSATQQELGATG